MIPFEDLVAALDAYTARTRGGSPSSSAPSRMPAGGYHPPTTEHMMPEDRQATIASAGPDGEPEGVHPIYDDRSNELDVGDVLSDEVS
jgi:hypothetical protein